MSQKTNLLRALPAVVIAALLVVAIIYAWTEPSSPPPSGNVSAPLNVSTTTQYKGGALGVGGVFQADGGVKVGSFAVKPACNAPSIGMIVFDTTNDQPYVCASTGWNPLDSKGTDIFGNGSDGDVVFATDTNLASVSGTDVETGIKQYNNLTINAGVKLSVASGHVLKFKVKDTLTINGEINMDGKGGMGAAWSSAGPGQTGDVADLVTGGDGGSSYYCGFPSNYCNIPSQSGKLGSGGGGGPNCGSQGGSNGGKTAASSNGVFTIGGNGGGGGAVCWGSGGSGGSGGGIIMISAKTIALNGNIYARGTGGGAPYVNGGGGGGGAGGIVIFEYQSKTGSGIIDVSGGGGAPVLGSGAYSTTAGGGAGGAGSKGIVILRKY